MNPEIVPVPGYEEHYGVSVDGRVFSFNYRNTGKTEEMTQSPHAGYRTVTLKRIKNSAFYVHRLVAMVFIPNPDGLPQVNHVDGDKSNNNRSNLEWVSQSENHLHAFRTGLRRAKSGESHFNHKLTDESVAEIKRELFSGNSYHGQLVALAGKYGVSASCVFDIKAGKAWRHI
jgi:hypothetical protein